MNEQVMRAYEGMFVLDPGNPDFNVAAEPIRQILARYGAEVLCLKPWDERRLAFEIMGRRRGLYVLTYFRIPTGRVAEIEHDCQLDERILRQLLIRRDALTDEQVQAETPATGGRRAAGHDDEAEGDGGYDRRDRRDGDSRDDFHDRRRDARREPRESREPLRQREPQRTAEGGQPGGPPQAHSQDGKAPQNGEARAD